MEVGVNGQDGVDGQRDSVLEISEFEQRHVPIQCQVQMANIVRETVLKMNLAQVCNWLNFQDFSLNRQQTTFWSNEGH